MFLLAGKAHIYVTSCFFVLAIVTSTVHFFCWAGPSWISGVGRNGLLLPSRLRGRDRPHSATVRCPSHARPHPPPAIAVGPAGGFRHGQAAGARRDAIWGFCRAAAAVGGGARRPRVLAPAARGGAGARAAAVYGTFWGGGRGAGAHGSLLRTNALPGGQLGCRWRRGYGGAAAVSWLCTRQVNGRGSGVRMHTWGGGARLFLFFSSHCIRGVFVLIPALSSVLPRLLRLLDCPCVS